MSLEKAIKSGKEHRKPYPYCKEVDKSCRNHGGCSFCLNNRTYQTRKQIIKTNQRIKEYNNND